MTIATSGPLLSGRSNPCGPIQEHPVDRVCSRCAEHLQVDAYGRCSNCELQVLRGERVEVPFEPEHVAPVRAQALRVLALGLVNGCALLFLAWLWFQAPAVLLLPLILVIPAVLLFLLVGNSWRLSRVWSALRGSGNPIIYSRHIEEAGSWLSEEANALVVHLRFRIRGAVGEQVRVVVRLRTTDGTYLRSQGCGEKKCCRSTGAFGEYIGQHMTDPVTYGLVSFRDIWLRVWADHLDLSSSQNVNALVAEALIGCDRELWAECDIGLPARCVEILASPKKGPGTSK